MKKMIGIVSIVFLVVSANAYAQHDHAAMEEPDATESLAVEPDETLVETEETDIGDTEEYADDDTAEDLAVEESAATGETPEYPDLLDAHYAKMQEHMEMMNTETDPDKKLEMMQDHMMMMRDGMMMMRGMKMGMMQGMKMAMPGPKMMKMKPRRSMQKAMSTSTKCMMMKKPRMMKMDKKKHRMTPAPMMNQMKLRQDMVDKRLDMMQLMLEQLVRLQTQTMATQAK